jgi:hypothetical protein
MFVFCIAQYNKIMQTRSGKKYTATETIAIQQKIRELRKQLDTKIEYNLSHGVYGQFCYIDDYAEISFLEESLSRL